MTGALNQRLRPLGHPAISARNTAHTCSISLDNVQDLFFDLGGKGFFTSAVHSYKATPVQDAFRGTLME